MIAGYRADTGTARSRWRSERKAQGSDKCSYTLVVATEAPLERWTGQQYRWGFITGIEAGISSTQAIRDSHRLFLHSGSGAAHPDSGAVTVAACLECPEVLRSAHRTT